MDAMQDFCAPGKREARETYVAQRIAEKRKQLQTMLAAHPNLTAIELPHSPCPHCKGNFKRLFCGDVWRCEFCFEATSPLFSAEQTHDERA